jgi:putative transcriptional regulator
MNKQPVLNIKALRQRRGLTQQQLADLLGLDQARISAYEVGRKSPPIHRLPVIAAALGVSINDIFAVGQQTDTAHEPAYSESQ